MDKKKELNPAEGEFNPLTPEVDAKCKQVMNELENVKAMITEKQESIKDHNKEIDEKIKKLSKLHPSIKINNKQRAAFEKDCETYIKALDGLAQDIQSKMAGLNEMITSTKESIEKMINMPKNKSGADIPFEFKKVFFLSYVEDIINKTKQFIKKIKKDIAVSHSRFNFNLETQKKQLNYLEMNLTRK